jgi:hypothetical protein
LRLGRGERERTLEYIERNIRDFFGVPFERTNEGERERDREISCNDKFV